MSMMHLLKKTLIEIYLCWFVHGELYVLYMTILEKIVGSTSSSSNIHEVADDNSNRYRSMAMDEMIINHGYLGKGSRVYEEPNIDITRFFELLKIPINHYRIGVQITINYPPLHECLLLS